MILTDETITLRAIEETDASVFYEMINSPEIEGSVLGNSYPVSMEQQKNWIKNLGNGNIVRYAIDNGEGAVGMCSISSIDMRNRTANLNVKLLQSERGRGYAKKALILVIDYCFLELNMNCLTANILARNTRSQKLFEKVNFICEGVQRQRVYKSGEYLDVLSYSLLRDEYERNR